MKACPVCSTEYADDVRFCPNDGQTLRATSPTPDLVGQVVADRYHVVRKLGAGGMGQVYLAEHVKMRRKSAIKVMNPAMAHDPDAVARFNREAANASRISHPNVCAIYDFGDTPEGLIYLAMEYIPGEPLSDVLERDGPLPIGRAVAVAVQVADALQAAHDLGIVHRDLKPDNIMLTRSRDGSDLVKVVDFGIAKAVGGEDGQTVTQTGLVVGTPEFMSPEQLSGDALDGRSDIYSLALVLFKMVTGKLPFEAATAHEAMIKRLTEEPLTLAAARPDLRFPPGLQATIDAALARKPLERYQSAAKFATDLTGVAGVQGRGELATGLPRTRADDETEPLDSGPSAPTVPMPHPGPASPAGPKKRSVATIVAGAVLVLGGAGAAMTLLGGGEEPGGAAREDATRRRADLTTRQPGLGSAGDTPSARSDAAKAEAALGALQDSIDVLPSGLLEDSARHIFAAYAAPAIRARAAYTLAQISLQRVKDLRAAHEWIETAVRLDPHTESYRRLRAAINLEYNP